MNKKVSIVVHSGSFHPDDVFAAATLLLALEDKPVEVVVQRSRDPEVIDKADFVADVGGVYEPDKNRFDHHQEGGAGERENRVPYAAFGLVWKKYGFDVCGSQDIADELDRQLVSPIDYGDNRGLQLKEIMPGVYPYSIDRMIDVFTNTYLETERDADESFFQLVSLAKQIIKREIVKTKALFEARLHVEKAYENANDKRVVVLEKDYPWLSVLLKHPEPLFVVFPNERFGNWGVSAIRKGEYEFSNRKDFPKEWGGKRTEELSALSGVSDAVFCHNRLFFSVAKSKEGALALAKKAVE